MESPRILEHDLMKMKRNEDETLRSYLLGEMSEESKELLENRLMTEELPLEDLEVAEQELIDDYVRGALATGEQESFERLFLRNPRRRRLVGISRDLRDYVTAASSPVWPEDESKGAVVVPFVNRLADRLASPAWQPAMAAVLLVAVVSVVWLAVGNAELERRLDDLGTSQSAMARASQALEQELAAERERSADLDRELGAEEVRITALTEEIDDLRAAIGRRVRAPSLAAVATMWLEPGGLTRGGGARQRLIVPADAQLVHLLLDIGVDDYRSYRAALLDESLDEVWAQSKLTARVVEDRVAVALTLPAEMLPRGDYSIRLSGFASSGDLELAGRYPFRVLED